MRYFGLSLAAFLLASSPANAEITGVKDVHIVARLTGSGAINDTIAYGIGGTDLGHMVNHQGKTYFIFGDTWYTPNHENGECKRANVVAYSTDADPSDGITFDGWITGPNVCGHAGWAREVINSGRVFLPLPTISEIPSAAVSIGNRIYTWFAAINLWIDPNTWTVNFAGLAYWEVGDLTFTVVPGFEIPWTSNFCQMATSFRTDLPPGQDDHLYIWGTITGRLGGVKLARVPPASVADLSAYRVFNGIDPTGQPIWGTNEFVCPLIVEPPVGMMSVMYNKAAGAWTMMYFNTASDAIELRQAPEPWGPWSAPLTVATGQAFPGLYGPYMNPLYVDNNGRTVYFTMSLWDPYDVYLMEATLELSSSTSPCGFGVGLPTLGFFWSVCFAWLVTLKVRRRSRSNRI